MTLFYDAIEEDRAQTHALVIGIDDYPHLEEGALYGSDPARFPMGLGQLTSPVRSATHIADWLVTLDNPRAPLGSVDLLLSSRMYSGANGAKPVRGTTFDDIRDTFDLWVRRCDHAGSVAIFYFCGHGISTSSRTLLITESYGRNRNVPFEDVIDFQTTYHAMENCAAATQLYFLDCCRNTPPQFWSVDYTGRPLLTGIPLVKRGRDAPVLFGSLQGQFARAPVGEVSFFTAALVEALKGIAADRPDNGRWKISTSKLQNAINKKIERITTLDVRCEQTGDTVKTSYVHETDDPTVLVTLDCRPEAALPCAHLRATDARARPLQRPPDPAPWHLELKAGECSAEAHFPTGDFADCRESCSINPPHFYWTLTV